MPTWAPRRPRAPRCTTLAGQGTCAACGGRDRPGWRLRVARGHCRGVPRADRGAPSGRPRREAVWWLRITVKPYLPAHLNLESCNTVHGRGGPRAVGRQRGAIGQAKHRRRGAVGGRWSPRGGRGGCWDPVGETKGRPSQRSRGRRRRERLGGGGLGRWRSGYGWRGGWRARQASCSRGMGRGQQGQRLFNGHADPVRKTRIRLRAWLIFF